MKKKYFICFIIVLAVFLISKTSYSFSIKSEMDYTLIPIRASYGDNKDKNSLIDERTSIINMNFSSKLTNDDSKFIIGPLCSVSRNEEYAQNVAIGLHIGYGNLQNHSFLMGFSVSYLETLRIENQIRYGLNSFMLIGKQDNIHLNIVNNGGLFGTLIPATTSKNTIELELALGYKELLPVFLLTNVRVSNVTKTLPDEQQIKYYSNLSYLHLAYYGNGINISAGVSSYMAKYSLEKEKGPGYTYETLAVFNKEQYYGGGITIKKKNIIQPIHSLFGEYHVLKNNSKFINICSVGIELIF